MSGWVSRSTSLSLLACVPDGHKCLYYYDCLLRFEATEIAPESSVFVDASEAAAAFNCSFSFSSRV